MEKYLKKSPNNSHIKCILFDLDNTLIETRKADARACEKIANDLRAKFNLNYEEATSMSTNFLSNFRKCPENAHMSLDKWRTYLWTQALGEKYQHDADSIYKNWLYQRYLSLAVPQEITYLLENLRKNYRIALITNGTSAAQWEKIDRLDLKSCFDLILVSGDLPHEKPNKNIFLQACDHLNIKPKNCLMVGDKLETDIQGGLEAGLAGTVWVPLGAHYNLAETDPQPNFILRNIMELKYLLSNAKEFEIRLMARRLKKSSLSSPSSSAYEAQSSCSRSTISNGHLLNNDRKSSRSSKQLYWTKLMAFRPEEDSNSNASDGS